MKPWGHVHHWGRTTRRLRGVPLYRCTTCPAEIYSKRAGGPAEGAFPWDLTGREWEMLRYLAQGRSRPWIARHMGVRSTTVNVYLSRMRVKMGIPAERVGLSDTAGLTFAYHCYINRNSARGWRT